MKHSIINLLSENGYTIKNIDDTDLIKKINTLLENPNLKIEMCNFKYVWKRKNGFKYNLKLILFTKPSGWIVDEERFVNMGNEDIDLTFIYNMIVDFINRKNLKYFKNGNKVSTSNNNNLLSSNDTDEDPYSERSIMKDLENGEGYKHGLD